MKTVLPISYEDVVKAENAIKDAVVDTRAAYSKTLSDITGADLFLKFEIFQYTASYKERGALNRLLAMSEAEKKRGVVAMSAGNHAQGVSYHAARLGIPATIVMPENTPFNKVKRTEELGARVVLAGADLDAATAAARALEAEEGLLFIHPFDDPLVMAGQGTVGLEFLSAFPEIDTLVVPIGGGGLISGIATVARHLNPDIRIIGIQSTAFPSMQVALAEDTGSVERGGQTIAEGIAVTKAGALTQDVVRQLVDDILIVPEARIEAAIVMLMEVEKVVVEGAGATGLAALLEYPELFKGRKVGSILTGGNIDSRMLSACIMRELFNDGRLSRLRIILLDQPGSLARVTALVASAGSNVLEVGHRRELGAISLKYTEMELMLETKDREHTLRVIEMLENEGFTVKEAWNG